MPSHILKADVRPLTVFTAGFGTESNTFLGEQITLASFESAFLFRPGEHPHELTEVSAPLYILRQAQIQRGWIVQEGTYAFALPGGRVERTTYENLRDEILGQISNAGALDFIALSLHGAMCAEGYDDCEGDFLQHVRQLVGPELPVGVEIDLHAHLTPAMLDAADVIIAYKEYPHTDFLDRAKELITLLEKAARTRWRPAKAVFDCRTIARFHTTIEPVRSFVQKLHEAERVPGIASVSFIHGFPGGDVRDMGAKVLVLADNYALASKWATQLGNQVIELRTRSTRPMMPIAEALERALQRSDQVTVIADVDDNPGSGAFGQDTTIISYLLDLPDIKACVGPLWGPAIVAAATAAGIGAPCLLPQRRWSDSSTEELTPLVTQVAGINPEVFQSWAGTRMYLGACCALRIGALTIVVSSKRDQAYSPDLFTALSIDASAQRLVVVKSAQHFVAGFSALSSSIILATGGGPLKSDFSKLHYQEVSRPIWPLDPSGTPNCLHHWVRHWAQVRPTAEAAVDPHFRLNYADLEAKVFSCAAALMKSGVEHGDRVAMLAGPGIQFLVYFLATASIGAIWLGLSPKSTAQELNDIIEKVAPKLLLGQPCIAGRDYHQWLVVKSQSIQTIMLGDSIQAETHLTCESEFIQQGEVLPREHVRDRIERTRPEDICLIVFTSGSSGPAKGAMITHASLSATAEVQAALWQVRPLRVLNNLPVNHIGCVGDLACYALIGGGTSVFAERFSPGEIPFLIKSEHVTVFGQVPSMFQLVLDSPGFKSTDLADVRLIFWGGAHASAALIARLREICPRLATSYGQTETVGSVTFTPFDPTRQTLEGTVGRAVPPYAIRIAATPKLIAHSSIGEIEVLTTFKFSGYWQNPAASQRAITDDGWLRTGDIGELLEDGCLRLVGRIHNVFKSGGYNVSAEEIEATLALLPGVRAASVISVADALWGHVAVAFIVMRAGSKDGEDIRNQLRSRLANYKIPKNIYFLDELPILPIGKVDKVSLAKLAQSLQHVVKNAPLTPC
jgi:microcystin degradation protein MlrC/acyl-CoA synthetase (AMP-forming)/AMP-acid ligase II